ncbi:MAG: TonB-dependent receptor [Gemmatimonadota bacterium]
MKSLCLAAAILGLGTSTALAQTDGSISGVVREAGDSARLVAGARISADGGRIIVLTNAQGGYRLRGLNSGWHTVSGTAIGYRPVLRDSVLVRDGQDTPLNFVLSADPVGLAPIEVIAIRVDSLLDPLAPADAQRFTGEDLHRMPVTTIDEALALSAGAVGQSYRGGRLGEQGTVVDGLGIKNQIDASTGAAGLRLPPDILAEGSLITNGISARYGQAVSALVELDTRDGTSRWQARTRYETDRPLGAGGDYGLDRAVVSVEGGLAKGVTVLGVADLSGRLDADPVNAPTPDNPHDPRHDQPWLLPHNSGQQVDLAAKLTASLATGMTLRLLGVHSGEERLLYDPAYKYDADLGPARRVTANLLTAHLQKSLLRSGILADLRVGYYDRQFTYGTADQDPDYSFGAFTSNRLHILGEDLARRQDTASARAPISGYLVPSLSDRTPWGVPAFFMARGSNGTLGWNEFRELRGRLDLSVVTTSNSELFVGAEYQGQKVQTFQRVQAWLPVGDSVPPATAATFHPHAGALYAEYQIRGRDLGLTAGVRYDEFRGREDLPGQAATTKRAVSPRVALSTVLQGATLVASYGRFQQAPDYQYLIDAAFDDTVRTGRFRRGNPDLGFESSTQYELSARIRPKPEISLRVNVYYRRLLGLVASVPLGVRVDSSQFGNEDFGTIKGVEAIVERSMKNHWAARVSYTLQQAQATSTSAFLLRQAWSVNPGNGDTIKPARVEFPLDYDRSRGLVAMVSAESPANLGPRLGGLRPFGGLQGTVIVQVSSGLPFSKVAPGTDSLIGLPNDYRLPGTQTVDLLLRKVITFGSARGGIYLDVRNLLNHRNTVAIRRDTGMPEALPSTVQQMAEAAYTAHPESIPYESTRYRSWADLNHDGYLEGRNELFPLYLAAAQDYTQPLFAFGPPRLIRMGVEFEF